MTARTSSFHFKGKDTTIAEIGKTLDVATILEGSVRKAGNRIRVSVQLVQVSDSSHLWSETYDRTLEDIFAVQDDIAHSVVKELRSALLGEVGNLDAARAAKAEVAKAAKGRRADPEACRLYLLARHLVDRHTREDTSRAIEYLEEALARAPEYALAWAELSRAYSREADRGWTPEVVGYGRAREAVERALSLDPDLPEGHAQMAWIRGVYWDFQGEEASMARALELAPGNVEALNSAGGRAYSLGQLEEAIGHFRWAVEQDPLSSTSYHRLGLVFDDAGRFGEAETAYRKALELAPQRTVTRSSLSRTLLALNRGEEALAEASREPHGAFRSWALAILHQGLDHSAESEAALEELIEKYSEYMAYPIAEIYAARGEADRAFEWLERAYTQRDLGLTIMRSARYLRSLHSDPRWGAFLKRTGL